MNAKENYLISIPVWGYDYLQIMLAYLIPSLLAPGNIPSLKNQGQVFIDIHCEKNFVNEIKKSDKYEEILKFCTIDFNIINPKDIKSALEVDALKYQLYGKLHLESIKKSADNGYNCIPIAPDVMFTDGYISNLGLLLEKYEVIFKTSLRADLDGIKDFKFTRKSNPMVLSVNVEEGRQILKKSLHLEMNQYRLRELNQTFSPHRLIINFLNRVFLYNADLHAVAISPEICLRLVELTQINELNGSIDSPDFMHFILLSTKSRKNIFYNLEDILGFQIDITHPDSRSVAGKSKKWKVFQIYKHYKQLTPTQKVFYKIPFIMNFSFDDEKKYNFYTFYKIFVIMILRLTNFGFLKNHNKV